MEFLDEYESKPRFLIQSKHLPEPPHSCSSSLASLHKPTLFLCVCVSLLICSLALIYFHFEPLQSFLLWLSISLLVGPFAPPSLTAGDIRVGVGPPIKEIPISPTEPNEKPSRKSTKSVKKASEDVVQSEKPIAIDSSQTRVDSGKNEEKWEEWSEDDDELLKKLMWKHPVGKPGRWEAIAEGLKGKHKVETVITKAKLIGVKKGNDQDSYEKFLKDRKPLDKRSVDENEESGCGWSSAEDLALLNALKAFPKDAAMRWEKVASSLPGKTKAACVKRVAELKKDFRTSKAAQPS